MKIDVAGVIGGDRVALEQFMSAARRSAKAGCNKVGADFLADDVAQELAMLFIHRLAHKFDEDYNVEPILIESARRIALAMMRRNKEVLTDDTEGLLDFVHGDINIRHDYHHGHTGDEGPVSAFDQKKAMDALKQAMPGVVIGKERNKPKVAPDSIVRKRGTASRVLPPQCLRLREIRLELGLSQEVFSAKLGIPTATLLSYEYGRTKRVKQDVMRRAEEIYSMERSVVSRNQELTGRSMRDIVSEWAQMLGVDKNDFKTLSEIIGVAKSTIHRWVDGEMRPRPRELNAYMRQVKTMARRLKRSAVMSHLDAPAVEKRS